MVGTTHDNDGVGSVSVHRDRGTACGRVFGLQEALCGYVVIFEVLELCLAERVCANLRWGVKEQREMKELSSSEKQGEGLEWSSMELEGVKGRFFSERRVRNIQWSE